MQPFRRCCLIVLTYTILVLIQQVAWAQADRSVEELREEQMQFGCQLKYNATLRDEFYDSIGNPADRSINHYNNNNMLLPSIIITIF